jgi:mRNA interferase MazF
VGVRRAGQVVLFRFPQTDLDVGKLRPALLIAPVPSTYDDWLVCMMSSQSHQAVSGIDELISTTDPDFASSGLRTDTVIRLTRLAVVAESIFVGRLGEVSDDRLQGLRSRLARWIEGSDS